VHVDCCRNLIPHSKNSARMHLKCPQELSIADRTRLECSRNVPNFDYVIDHGLAYFRDDDADGVSCHTEAVHEAGVLVT